MRAQDAFVALQECDKGHGGEWVVGRAVRAAHDGLAKRVSRLLGMEWDEEK